VRALSERRAGTSGALGTAFSPISAELPAYQRFSRTVAAVTNLELM